MAQMQFITIISVECVTMDDMLGEDAIIGKFDKIPNHFEIGKFTAGKRNEVGIGMSIPVQSDRLDILETDFTGDDLIGSIDLNERIYTVQIVTLSNGSASYRVEYQLS
jgi:hypothetical protein